MKKVLLAIISLIGAFMVSAQNVPAQGAKFKFVEEVHDFGVLKSGPVAMHTFEFENTGSEALFIMDVKPSCACTKVDWPKAPVKPGEKGSITLGVKTAELHGIFNKDVWVQSNAVNNPGGEKRYRLRIKGETRE